MSLQLTYNFLASQIPYNYWTEQATRHRAATRGLPHYLWDHRRESAWCLRWSRSIRECLSHLIHWRGGRHSAVPREKRLHPWPKRILKLSPVVVFQVQTVLSSEALASRPLGSTASRLTLPVCPVRLRICLPLLIFQILIISSPEALANSPVGNATSELMTPVWPRKIRTGAPVVELTI